MKRFDRVFGTLVGWLIGLGMVAFAVVGFSAINQATPLSASNYLSGASASQTGGANAGGPSAPSTQTHSSGKSSSSGASSGNTASGSPSGKGASNLSQAQLVTMGQSIITAKCVACHVVNGKGGPVGPNLDSVFAGKTVSGMVPGGKPTDKAWLTRWISNPQAVWSAASMPNLGLNATQVQAVVAYLTTKVK